MKKLNLFNNLRNKIVFICFIIIFLFLFALILLVRTNISNKIKNDTVESIISEQIQMDEGITMVLDSISLVYNPIVTDPDFQDIVTNGYTKSEIEAFFHQLIENYPINKTIFQEIILYYEGDYYYGGLTNNEILINDVEFANRVTNSKKLIEEGPMGSIDGSKYLIFGKPLRNVRNGSLLFAIKERAIFNMIDAIDKTLGYTFIVSNQELMISHPEEKFVGNIVFGFETFNFSSKERYQIQNFAGEKSIIIINKANKITTQYELNWHIISVLSYDYLFEGLLQVNLSNMFITIGMAIIALALAIILSPSLVGPINKLKTRVKSTSLEKRNNPSLLGTGDEIEDLEKSFNEMLRRITELINKNEEEAENKRKLELYALQMQINPHFLYNTLDAIAWLAKLKKEPEIEHLVLALAKFFRISLHKGDKFITVLEEIEIIKNFIEIELIRFPDKFTVEYNIDSSTKNLQTMKLILQPIVENAIKHGISVMEEKGHITINAFNDDEYIYFNVIDDGLGFDPTNIDYMKKKQISSSGYGIKNVDERIKLEYGENCGITIDSKPNGGTKVTIKIIKRD